MIAAVCCAIVTGGAAGGATPPDLDKRIAAQRAVEGVYWRHRIWPAENPGPKPSLDQVLPESALRAKVKNAILESEALDQLWGQPIRNEDLQAEVARIVTATRAPEMLREILDALQGDPTLVAECLARPLLADRLIRQAYARDPRFHLELKTAIERSLAAHVTASDAAALGGQFVEAVWTVGEGRVPRAILRRGGAREIRLDSEGWREEVARLGAGFETTPSGAAQVEDLPVGVFGRLQENDESFFVQAVLEKEDARLRIATVSWRKVPFDEWWAGTKASLTAAGSPGGSPGTGTHAEFTPGTAPPLPSASAAQCVNDTWTTVQSTGAPSAREAHTAVWTGSEMIVWGGYNATSNTDTNTGGRYTPATDSWTPTATTGGVPTPRDTQTAVWTGTKMVVWGGNDVTFVPMDTGGRYDPATDTWAATTTTGAPSARLNHAAVWSGSKMVVWGGFDGTKDVDTGGRYDPTGDSWATTAKAGAPSARDSHTAVWTGDRMMVWGGWDDTSVPQNTGARYDPVGNGWTAISVTGAPAARVFHTAVWTASRMIVWGGTDTIADLNTGGSYDPVGDVWTTTSTVGAPAARDSQTAVWADSTSEMLVWGGQDDVPTQLNSGGRYNPTTNGWTTMSTVSAPTGRRYHTTIWAGSVMVPWGGWNAVDLNSGGRYCASSCTTPVPTGSSTITMSKEGGGTRVSWITISNATAYDLVRGLLNELRSSSGNFTTSTDACLANDQAATSVLDPATPAVGNGYWYLVRGVSCSGVSSYDDPSASQSGSRDAEINASASSCP